MSPGLYVASGFGSTRRKPQILACREVNKSEMVNNKSENREEQITRCGLSVGGVSMSPHKYKYRLSGIEQAWWLIGGAKKYKCLFHV